MKIGIDAKWYYNGPPSGKVIIQNLVANIINCDLKNEIFLFFDRKYKNVEIDFPKERVTIIYVWADNNLFANLFILPIFITKYDIDVVLFQFFAPPWGKYKKIVHTHGISFMIYPHYFTLIERIYFAPIKMLSNKAHITIAVSENEKKEMRNHGFSGRCEVVYNGISDIFLYRKDYDIIKMDNIKKMYNLPEKYLLFVGRINIVKNIGKLLEALSRMKSAIPLVIVGSKDWKVSDIKSIIERNKLHERLIFIEHLAQCDLQYLYALAEVFCFPSFYESFGIPPLESMAMGTPVIVSRRASLPEVCGDAGVFVDPENPEDIAEKIDGLLFNREYYELKVRLGLEHVKKFTWEKTARRVIELYESLGEEIT